MLPPPLLMILPPRPLSLWLTPPPARDRPLRPLRPRRLLRPLARPRPRSRGRLPQGEAAHMDTTDARTAGLWPASGAAAGWGPRRRLRCFRARFPLVRLSAVSLAFLARD